MERSFGILAAGFNRCSFAVELASHFPEDENEINSLLDLAEHAGSSGSKTWSCFGFLDVYSMSAYVFISLWTEKSQHAALIKQSGII